MQPGVVVVPEAARVEVDDLLERRQPARDLQHLVDLLLVAGDHEARAAMLEDEGHLLGHRVLVERHRHRAADLRRDHRPVERGTVAADDRHVVAGAETEPGEAGGERHDLGLGLGPGPALPDAVFLLAVRGAPAALAGIPGEQLRKGVRIRGAYRLAHAADVLPSRGGLGPPARAGETSNNPSGVPQEKLNQRSINPGRRSARA